MQGRRASIVICVLLSLATLALTLLEVVSPKVAFGVLTALYLIVRSFG